MSILTQSLFHPLEASTMEIAGQWEMSYRTGAHPGSASSLCCNNKISEISELTTQVVRIPVGALRKRDRRLYGIIADAIRSYRCVAGRRSGSHPR